MKWPFRMITLKQILSQICLGDWFMSLDLKDAYFHIQVAPHHRRFLRFVFEGVAYQYKVLPFGLSLAPRTFTRCMDAALSPLRQMGIRILNYLDDWLILAQSQAFLTSHKTLLLSHLVCLWLRVNLAKSRLSPSQRVSFLVLSTVPRWQQPSQRSETRQFSVTCLPSRKGQPVRSKLSWECWALWQLLRRYFGWVCFTCDLSSSGWSRGFNPRLGITDATE